MGYVRAASKAIKTISKKAKQKKKALARKVSKSQVAKKTKSGIKKVKKNLRQDKRAIAKSPTVKKIAGSRVVKASSKAANKATKIVSNNRGTVGLGVGYGAGMYDEKSKARKEGRA